MKQLLSTAFSTAGKQLWRKKSRTFLTMAGIAIGVFSVVLISMISATGKKMITSELSSLGMDGLFIRTESSSQKLSEENLDQIRKTDQVVSVSPLVTDYSTVKIREQKEKLVLWGVDENATAILSTQLVHGRKLTHADASSLSQVCVVDESFAMEQYHRSNIVGKTLQIYLGKQYESFEIVGVARSGGAMMQNMMGDMVPSFVYLPYTTMQSLSLSSGFSQAVAKIKPDADPDMTGQAIIQNLSQESDTKIQVEDLNSQMNQLNSVLDTVTLALAAIAGISLLVAGLSIMTVMMVSVGERTREIGIKKSIGATQGMILLEFLMESCLLSLSGAIVGAISGLTAGALGCLAFGFSPGVDWRMVWIAIGFSVAAGIVFGVYPAKKAASLRPVDALRFA
ncbi:MAG: ABC transporter permease [Massiliimalia sp.]|jgi:putative ABC transport system permease protein